MLTLRAIAAAAEILQEWSEVLRPEAHGKLAVFSKSAMLCAGQASHDASSLDGIKQRTPSLLKLPTHAQDCQG